MAKFHPKILAMSQSTRMEPTFSDKGAARVVDEGVEKRQERDEKRKKGDKRDAVES
jgi:hypothetical protein